jgi:hypothetical protein
MLLSDRRWSFWKRVEFSEIPSNVKFGLDVNAELFFQNATS